MYVVSLAHELQRIRAEKFIQSGDFVSFYTKDEEGMHVTALVRLGHGDSIVEERVADAEVKQQT
jgi:hypothetical protein